MRGGARTCGRFGVAVVVGLLLLAHLGGGARAQEYAAGWYGPYDDGCLHWWDGYQWTDDIDCNGDGYTDTAAAIYPAGWYGPYDDGCLHWWDGYQWTLDVDCDGDGYTDNATASYPAGWYGPFSDRCYYWWDGSQYTGEYDCNGDGDTDATNETYQPGWYDLYGDGCLYWFDGSQYTGDKDCNGDGRSDAKRGPDEVDTSDIGRFINDQLAAIDGMWSKRFANSGLSYSDPDLVIAKKPITIGCTTKDGDKLLETKDWIFYCPTDDTIYFGPGNLDRIVQSGIGVVQFTVAHEIGHHVQDEIDPDFWTKYGNDPVAYESQATCMAGIWFNRLDAEGTPSDINAAMTYLSTATDEVHGKGEDQVSALLKGYQDPNAC